MRKGRLGRRGIAVAALLALVMGAGRAAAGDLAELDLSPYAELPKLGVGFQELGGYLPPANLLGDNQATVTQDGSANRAVVTQYGAGNQLSASQTGSANAAALLQIGAQNSIGLTQLGDANQALIVQAGFANNAQVVQNGSNNIAQVVQLGIGLSATVTQNGNNQFARIVQRN